MLYTITFNPSLDYYLKVNNIRRGAVNRAAGEKLIPGGKGINVSLALKELGNDTTALGFFAGFTGRAILSEINERGLKNDFIEVEGQTRINVKIKSVAETDINGEGAYVTAGDTMVAGFIHEYIDTGNYFKALNFATAAGSACAFTETLPTREQIEYVESLML